jgi:c-di-GMP-binding flagellar brake protein YcgR
MTKAFRFALATDVEMTVEGFPRPVQATVLDISLGGCRIATRSILLTGSKVDFQLPLGIRSSVQIKGKVKHAAPGGDNGSLEIGIEFAQLPAGDAAALSAFIEEGRASDSEGQNSIRVETEFPIIVAMQGQKPFEALAIDIGRGGMRIAFERQLPTGGTVALNFALADSSGMRLDVKVRGKIVGSAKAFKEFHHNVVFIDTSPAVSEAIARFVRAKQLDEMRSR